jgi:hypothetical protein
VNEVVDRRGRRGRRRGRRGRRRGRRGRRRRKTPCCFTNGNKGNNSGTFICILLCHMNGPVWFRRKGKGSLILCKMIR